jgi:hypothetical protein
MTKDDADIVQLLIDTGVLSAEDAQSVQTAQSEVLLTMMVQKRALLPSEVENAREILNELMAGVNQTRRLKAQMSLVQIITGNLHRRMGQAGDRLRTQKERITSGDWPAVAPALAKPKGG